jgi:hypothetical protein
LPKILTWELFRCPSRAWHLFFVQVAGFARQARPQSRPRYFWTHSEANVHLCCPHLNPLGRGDPSRSDSGPPHCSAWSRAGHPRQEASGSGGGRDDVHAPIILTFSLQKCQSEVVPNYARATRNGHGHRDSRVRLLRSSIVFTKAATFTAFTWHCMLARRSMISWHSARVMRLCKRG